MRKLLKANKGNFELAGLSFRLLPLDEDGALVIALDDGASLLSTLLGNQEAQRSLNS